MNNDKYYHGRKSRNRAILTPVQDWGKYQRHRLPGVVVTKKGTVIIYCEARTELETDRVGSGSDWCMKDIYVRRSTDGGETFELPQYIAFGDRVAESMDNPVMTVAEDNTLHLLYSKNFCLAPHGGIWYTRSTDDGVTWEPSRNITNTIKDLDYRIFTFGPGHGLCTRNGKLIVPVWSKNEAKEISTRTIYSDDNGNTWSLGERASDNQDETAIAELSDGSIMLNSRRKPFRRITVSPDGISQWSKSYDDKRLPDPACMGGMETVRIDGLPHAILFINCAHKEKRENVTLRCSFDDGKTWKSLVIDKYEGGYSDVAVDSVTGKGYIIYETFTGYVTRFTTFSFYDTFCKNLNIK